MPKKMCFAGFESLPVNRLTASLRLDLKLPEYPQILKNSNNNHSVPSKLLMAWTSASKSVSLSGK